MARGLSSFSKSFKLSIKFKAEFEDTQRILSRIGQSAKRSLMRQGGFIRTTAVHSIKTAKGPSAPGSPPHNHPGLTRKQHTQSLRKLLFFRWDDSAKSMVVGPELLPSGQLDPTVPGILEAGGTEMATVKVGTAWVRKRITIAPRPYMAPALKLSQAKLPEYWANSLV